MPFTLEATEKVLAYISEEKGIETDSSDTMTHRYFVYDKLSELCKDFPFTNGWNIQYRKRTVTNQ